MIEIKNIEIHNFNSIQDLSLSFEEGLHLILGENRDSTFTASNGSGKSSIAEALVYALYGKPTKSNHQRYGTDDTYVKVELHKDNDIIEIVRYYKHKKYKNQLQLFVNGEDISQHTKKHTEDYLQKILSMPYEHFISSIVIMQGFPVKLLSMTPTQRKTYFTELIDFDFDEVLKKLKNDKTIYETDLQEVKTKKNALQNELSKIEGQLIGIIDFTEIVNPEEVEKLKQQYKDIEEKLNDKQKELRQLQQSYSKIEKEYTAKSSKLLLQIKQYEEIIKNKQCPVCFSKPSFEFKQRYKKLVSEYKALLQSNLKNQYEDKIKELQSEVDEFKEKKIKTYSQLAELIKKQKLSKERQEKLDSLQDRKQYLEKEIQQLEDKEFDLEDNLQKTKDLINLFSPSGEIRNILLKNYIDFFNQILKNISSNFDTTPIQFKITDKGLQLSGIDYYSLSGGEKRKYDIIVQFAFSDFLQMLNNVDFNIRIYDEILDNLDSTAQEVVVNYITSTMYDKSLYFISHNENLKSYFTDIVKIIKENGITYMEEG